MLGARYAAVTPDSFAVTAAQHLLRVSAPSTAAMLLHRAWVSQEGSETSDQLKVQILRTTDDGTGTTFTPVRLAAVYAAFTTNGAAYDFSVDATEGDILIPDGFNFLNGFLWTPAVPSEIIVVPPSGRIALKLDSAPAASTLVIAGMIVELVG